MQAALVELLHTNFFFCRNFYGSQVTFGAKDVEKVSRYLVRSHSLAAALSSYHNPTLDDQSGWALALVGWPDITDQVSPRTDSNNRIHMQGNVKDKLLHGNCFSKRIGAGKVILHSGPRKRVRPSACMDCLLVGAGWKEQV